MENKNRNLTLIKEDLFSLVNIIAFQFLSVCIVLFDVHDTLHHWHEFP